MTGAQLAEVLQLHSQGTHPPGEKLKLFIVHWQQKIKIKNKNKNKNRTKTYKNILMLLNIFLLFVFISMRYKLRTQSSKPTLVIFNHININ